MLNPLLLLALAAGGVDADLAPPPPLPPAPRPPPMSRGRGYMYDPTDPGDSSLLDWNASVHGRGVSLRVGPPRSTLPLDQQAERKRRNKAAKQARRRNR